MHLRITLHAIKVRDDELDGELELVAGADHQLVSVSVPGVVLKEIAHRSRK